VQAQNTVIKPIDFLTMSVNIKDNTNKYLDKIAQTFEAVIASTTD
jgi:hypothetical protein